MSLHAILLSLMLIIALQGLKLMTTASMPVLDRKNKVGAQHYAS